MGMYPPVQQNRTDHLEPQHRLLWVLDLVSSSRNAKGSGHHLRISICKKLNMQKPATTVFPGRISQWIPMILSIKLYDARCLFEHRSLSLSPEAA